MYKLVDHMRTPFVVSSKSFINKTHQRRVKKHRNVVCPNCFYCDYKTQVRVAFKHMTTLIPESCTISPNLKIGVG